MILTKDMIGESIIATNVWNPLQRCCGKLLQINPVRILTDESVYQCDNCIYEYDYRVKYIQLIHNTNLHNSEWKRLCDNFNLLKEMYK